MAALGEPYMRRHRRHSHRIPPPVEAGASPKLLDLLRRWGVLHAKRCSNRGKAKSTQVPAQDHKFAPIANCKECSYDPLLSR